MIAGKVWGTTQLLLATPMLEVHRLVVIPQAFCSLHKHEGRWNAFLVTAGLLYVEIHQEAYPLVDVTAAVVGELTTVSPGLVHRFYTKEEGAECFELYYPPALGGDDIVRLEVGGREDGTKVHMEFEVQAVDAKSLAAKMEALREAP